MDHGRAVMVAVLAVFGCGVPKGAPPAVDPAPAPLATEAELVIYENAQGALGGVSVGVGNLWERDYTLPDGTPTRGMTAMLFLGDDSRVVVGVGTELELGGVRWRIEAIDKTPGGKGAVHIGRAGSTP